MLDEQEIAMVAEMLSEMTEEEIEIGLKTLEELVEMKNTVNSAYQTNPMVFSDFDVVQ